MEPACFSDVGSLLLGPPTSKKCFSYRLCRFIVRTVINILVLVPERVTSILAHIGFKRFSRLLSPSPVQYCVKSLRSFHSRTSGEAGPVLHSNSRYRGTEDTTRTCASFSGRRDALLNMFEAIRFRKSIPSQSSGLSSSRRTAIGYTVQSWMLSPRLRRAWFHAE